jgi:predicted PhzF superfamily epimerase YddE/YHI9
MPSACSPTRICPPAENGPPGHCGGTLHPARQRAEGYVDKIAAAFGIKRDRVLAHQWVDNGSGWAVVRLPTAGEVLALEPDLSVIPTAMVGGAATGYIRGIITL